jgi:hypothetical protein
MKQEVIDWMNDNKKKFEAMGYKKKYQAFIDKENYIRDMIEFEKIEIEHNKMMYERENEQIERYYERERYIQELEKEYNKEMREHIQKKACEMTNKDMYFLTKKDLFDAKIEMTTFKIIQLPSRY